MITNEPNTLNSFYSSNAGLSQLETSLPKPSVFNIYYWSWSSWFVFLIFLSFLGFNVFVFLAKGTMTFVDFFMLCVLRIYTFFQNLVDSLGKNADSTSFSSSSSSSPSSSPDTDYLSVQASTEHSNESPSEITKEDAQVNVGTDDDIMKALKNANMKNMAFSKNSLLEQKEKKQMGGLTQREVGQDPRMPGQVEKPDDPVYHADDSYSSIQMSKSASKSGWCFIGEDRGFRSCIRVDENEECMSGDIFPNRENCINKNLRN
jgi:hypothetical protein